jgi:hypothetical protein
METNFRRLGIEVSNAYIKTLKYPRIINCNSTYSSELRDYARNASNKFCNFVKLHYSEYLKFIINENDNYYAFREFLNGIMDNINKLPYIASHEAIAVDFFERHLHETLYNNYVFPNVNGIFVESKEKDDSEIDETKVGWELILPVLFVFVFFVFFAINTPGIQNNHEQDTREINLEVPTEAKVNAEVDYKNDIVELKNL